MHDPDLTLAEVAEDLRELAADVADLGRRLTIAELAIEGERSQRVAGEQEISTRITAVHNRALRELTRRAEGSPTA